MVEMLGFDGCGSATVSAVNVTDTIKETAVKHLRSLVMLTTIAALFVQMLTITVRADMETAAVSPNWATATIDDFTNYDWGNRPSIAINPATQQPYISAYDATNGALRLVRRALGVTNGGCNGDPATPGTIDGWMCSQLAETGQSGYESSIAFEENSSGNFGVLYTDPYVGKLTLDRYTANLQPVSNTPLLDVDGPGDYGIAEVRFPSLGFSGSTPIYASYGFYFNAYADTYRSLIEHMYLDGVSNYDGNLEEVARDDPPALTLGYYASLDKPYNTPAGRVAYRGAGNGPLKFAQWIGGDTAPGCARAEGGTYPGWQCSIVDPTPLTGYYIDHHAPDNANDLTRIAYYDDTNKTVKSAVYTGNPGHSCGAGGMVGWYCQTIDSVAKGKDSSGLDVALAVINGKPVVAYADKDDAANTVLKVARYVGANGNCGLDNGQYRWKCEVVDDGNGSNSVGRDLDMAVDNNGVPYIAYYDATAKALKVAQGKLAAPTFSVAYTPSPVTAGGTTTVTYTITNSSASTLTGLTFEHWFSPLKVSATPTIANSCGGTFGKLSDITVKLTGGTLQPQQTCVISVQVVAPPWMITVGTYNLQLVSDNAATATAPNVELTVTPAAKLDQTITFAPIPNTPYTNGDVTPTVSASSSLPVTLSASGACTIFENTVIVFSKGVGLCSVKANQAGNAQFNAAPEVTIAFEVYTITQTISFDPLPDRTVGDTPFKVSAKASSSWPVVYTASGKCSVSGNTVTLSGGAGSCTITATQEGNLEYSFAQMSRSFAINDPAKKAQTITFAALPDRTVGDAPFTVSATASSGLQVQFAASGQCAISGNKVTVNGAGSCTITARQTGNAQFNAAADVPRTFKVNAKAAAVKHTVFVPMFSN